MAYLDHASTTPLRPEARSAVVEAMDADWGDPSRVHQQGHAARAHLEDARDRVAALVGARSREVIFTSGATEAIAAACWGAAERGPLQVASEVEHSAVRLSAAVFGTVAPLGVDGDGQIQADSVDPQLSEGVGLVHIQFGNHEVGTLQPVAEVIERCRARGVLVHVDAAQAVGRVAFDFRELGADLVSISGHKFGAPLGTGALLVRRGLRLRPLLLGGDQERLRRAGIENTPAILGFAAGLTAATSEIAAGEPARQTELTSRLRSGIGAIDGVVAYGHATDRLPHIACFGIDGVEPQAVLFGLDRHGIAAHSGSACASVDLEPSPVLAAMGVDAHRSLRLSVGSTTSTADIDDAVGRVADVVAELRDLRPG